LSTCFVHARLDESLTVQALGKAAPVTMATSTAPPGGVNDAVVSAADPDVSSTTAGDEASIDGVDPPDAGISYAEVVVGVLAPVAPADTAVPEVTVPL
jgi:hypothetical protein